MNNKILIGSIIAITVLIGTSFTSVVGYKSITSDVIASPLFNIRSSRAIDEKNNIVTSEYVGKDRILNISIPKRNFTMAIIGDAISKIKHMYKGEIDKLRDNIMNHNLYKDIDINNLEQSIDDISKLLTSEEFCTLNDAYGLECLIVSFIIVVLLALYVLPYVIVAVPLLILASPILIMIAIPLAILWLIVAYICGPTGTCSNLYSY